MALLGCASKTASVGPQSRCVGSQDHLEPGPGAECAKFCLPWTAYIIENGVNSSLIKPSTQEVARMQDTEKKKI